MRTPGITGVLIFLFGMVAHDAAARCHQDGTPWADLGRARLRNPAGLKLDATGNASPGTIVGVSFPGSIRPCIPQPEVCNFRDDDCDGAIDEGFGVIRCGTGACASSVPACFAGIAGRCIPRPPGEEICNGVDDDCDGETDEGVCPGAGSSSGGPSDDRPPDVGSCRWGAGQGSAGAAGWLILLFALGTARRKTGPCQPCTRRKHRAISKTDLS